MAKGVARRVVMIKPESALFEQAIFIVKADSAGQGVSAEQVVREAERTAREFYSRIPGRRPRRTGAAPLFYLLCGAVSTSLFWLLLQIFR